MSVMFAQAGEVTQTQFTGGMLAALAVLLLPFLRDLLKDRRERESDTAKQKHLADIATSNKELCVEMRSMKDAQVASNLNFVAAVSETKGRQEVTEKLRLAQHQALLSAVQCKANCPLNQKQT